MLAKWLNYQAQLCICHNSNLNDENVHAKDVIIWHPSAFANYSHPYAKMMNNYLKRNKVFPSKIRSLHLSIVFDGGSVPESK